MLVISVDKQCSAGLLPVFSESSCLQTAAPVDLGGGDWLEPVTGAAGMGWLGSCRRVSGVGSLEFDIFGSCDSWLMVIWRAAIL